MPTAGPYGITQFDAAGVLGAYQQAQQNRIQMMLTQRQIAREDKEAERASGVSRALQAYTGGDTAAPSAATGATGISTALGGQTGQAAPTATPAARQHTAADRERLFNSLVAIDPQVAGQVWDALGKMDQTKAEAAKARNAVLGRAAAHLLSIPQGPQRQAELQRIAPVLIQDGGITADQLSGFEVNDNNLNFVLNQSRDIDKIVEATQPDYMNVNGDVIDKHALARGDHDPVRYRSEYIDTPQGLARRPDSGVPHTLTDDDIRRMEQGGPTGGPSGGFPVNNPGALRVPGSTRFQSFNSQAEGVYAQEALLGRYHQRGLKTVASVIETYAPRKSRGGDNSDESVNNYIGYVSKRLGVNPADTLAAPMISRLAEAMREFETGHRR